MKCPVEFTVNGKRIEREVEPRTLLVHFLREELGLTGTHIGCETSICGACTILVNGRAAKSCTLLTVQADGSTITTIEGLAPMARDEGLVGENELHPLQEGFRQCHGLQCGFCTPGMILVSKAFLDHNPEPSEAEIRHALEGNYCRCTGYQHIVQSVQYAASELAKK
jgi:carbon-monoxide dehydrogenase small subunit